MKLSYEPSQIYSYKFWAKLQSKIRHKLKHKPNFLKLSEAETGFEPAILWFAGERATDVATRTQQLEKWSKLPDIDFH